MNDYPTAVYGIANDYTIRIILGMGSANERRDVVSHCLSPYPEWYLYNTKKSPAPGYHYLPMGVCWRPYIILYVSVYIQFLFIDLLPKMEYTFYAMNHLGSDKFFLKEFMIQPFHEWEYALKCLMG